MIKLKQPGSSTSSLDNLWSLDNSTHPRIGLCERLFSGITTKNYNYFSKIDAVSEAGYQELARKLQN